MSPDAMRDELVRSIGRPVPAGLAALLAAMASDAVATLRELVSGPDVPPAVRLRASLAILQAADAMKAETIGPTSARGVKTSMDHRALMESLGG